MTRVLQGIVLWALSAGLLAGCVTFEHAPVARYRCDPALTGQWQTIKTDRLARPIEVDRDCRVRWPLDDGQVYDTRLRSFAFGDDRYLAFTPDEVDTLMKMEGNLAEAAPAESVILVRYRIEGDDIRVWLADADAVLAEDARSGTTARRMDESIVHVEGSRRDTRTLLRERGDVLFRAQSEAGTSRFRRVAAEIAP